MAFADVSFTRKSLIALLSSDACEDTSTYCQNQYASCCDGACGDTWTDYFHTNCKKLCGKCSGKSWPGLLSWQSMNWPTSYWIPQCKLFWSLFLAMLHGGYNLSVCLLRGKLVRAALTNHREIFGGGQGPYQERLSPEPARSVKVRARKGREIWISAILHWKKAAVLPIFLAS